MGCMGSKNKAPVKTVVTKKADPVTKNIAKWWVEPIGKDHNIALSLDNKMATAKQGS
jgi:hypothetical protein